jgi:hypothetical protein
MGLPYACELDSYACESGSNEFQCEMSVID